MPVSEYTPQLNFLKDSASSLNISSPSTAAHLLAGHNHILHNDFKSLNQRHQEYCCGACGTIRSPETSKTIQIRKKKLKRTGVSTDGATIYKCLRCHRRTVKPVRKEPVRSKVPAKPTTTVEESISTTATSTDKTVSEQSASEPASKTAENASSKKRAKARKQGGLQALLASKQQSQSASSSLDLFDFLQ